MAGRFSQPFKETLDWEGRDHTRKHSLRSSGVNVFLELFSVVAEAIILCKSKMGDDLQEF